MKKTDERTGALLNALKARARVTLAEAMELLDASESTARRLFSRLEGEGLAIRVHGALALKSADAGGYSYDAVEQVLLTEKKRIADAALAKFSDAASVYLDSGNTVFQLAARLAEAARGGGRVGPTVFTNSLKNLEVLSGALPVQLIGGVYRVNRRDFCGFLAEEALARLHFDLCVLGADGISPEQGLTTTDFDTARLGLMAVERSRKRLVVADATKFERCALVRYAALSSIDEIITDRSLPDEAARAAEAVGPRVARV